MDLSLDDIALFVTTKASAWYFSGTILVLALLAFMSLRLRIAPLVAEMKRASLTIEALPDRAALVMRLHDLDEQLGSGVLLGPAWREFRATLVLPEANREQRLLATCAPTTVFRARPLLMAHLNLSFYQAMPNMLVGLGILGTFIGLLFGIHVASKGLAAPDMAVARGALQGLLSAAALKFSTSVTGLMASLLFSWREKQWNHRFESFTTRFTAALEIRLERITPEAIALSSVRALVRQEALLESLPNRLGEAVASHLAPQFAALTKSVDAQGLAISKRLEQFSRDLAQNRPAQNMGGDETALLSATLARVGMALENHTSELQNHATHAGVRDLADSFREGGEALKREMAQTLNTMLERLSHSIDELAGHLASAGAVAARDLGQAASGVDAAGGRLALAVGGMETTFTTFARFGGEVEHLLRGLREVQAGFMATAQPIAEAGSAFRTSATRVENSAGRMQEAIEGLRVTTTELSRMENQVCGQWQEYEERFTNVDAALANTFHELDKGLSRTTHLVQEWLEGLDQNTAGIVRELTAATVELRETVADLTEALVEARK